MARPRRTPPLFEVIKEPLRRVQHGGAPGTGSSAQQPPPPHAHTGNGNGQHHAGYAAEPAPRSVPNRIEPAPASPQPARPAVEIEARTPVALQVSDQTPWTGEEAPQRRLVLSQTGILFAVAGALGLVVLVWAAAYKLGAASERNRVGAFDGTPPVAPEGTAPKDPLIDDLNRSVQPPQPKSSDNTPKTRPPAPDAGKTKPAPTPAPTPTGTGAGLIADPRQPGHNYLIIAQLNAKDAEAAVAFLNAGGVKAVAFPKKKMDAAEARAKNELFWVIDSQGYPSAEYKELSRRADNPVAARINTVIGLGRKWKRDAKGATDFDDCYYELFKGK